MSNKRISSCETCGQQVEAGLRGPLPRFCPEHRTERHRDRSRAAYRPRPKRDARPERWKHKPGDRFGSLVLVERVGKSQRGVFACDCGNVKAVSIGNVASGAVVNCADRSQHEDPRKREVVGYRQAHKRIELERGNAANYDCAAPDCVARAGHWAYLHGSTEPLAEADKRDSGPYMLDPTMYAPLCRHHHQKWDQAHKRQTNGHGAGASLAHVTAWEATR